MPRSSTLLLSFSSPSHVSGVMKFGAGACEKPFVKVKKLITDLLNKVAVGGCVRGQMLLRKCFQQ